MTDEVQEALRSTLRAASLDAPEAQTDLLDRLAARHRTRRRNRAMATAAATLATALVVTGGTSFALRTGGEPRPGALSGRDSRAMPKEKVPSPVPVPQAAVRTVPDTLPNGLRYAPEVALDSGSLLVSTQTSPGSIDRLWVYDLRTRRASKVTDVPEPDGASEYAGGFAVGDGEVVWSVTDGPGDGAATEIWAAPLGGGTARKVVSMAASAKEGQVGQLVVADGRIRWSPEAFEDASVVEVTGGSTGAVEPAVYEVPLAGGRPRMVPGTAGYLIMSWPWIGAPGSSGGKTGDVAFRTMRNLETGETRAVSVPNTWKCGISWCLGVAPTNVTLNRVPDLHVLPLAGGTGRTLVGDALAIDGPVLYDRFVNTVIRPGKHNALYDLSSGKVLDIGPNYRDSIPQSIPSARGDGSGVALDRYLIKETKGAFEIVDLAAAD